MVNNRRLLNDKITYGEEGPGLKDHQNPPSLSSSSNCREYLNAPSMLVGNPVLLENARCLGSMLQETGVEVLGLEGTSVKKLNAAHIFTIEQLACSDERTLLRIPHFGTGKVNSIKTCLNSYLMSIRDGYTPSVQETGEELSAQTPEVRGPRKKPAKMSLKRNSRSMAGSLSERIRQLERRIVLLESRLTKIGKTHH